MTITINYNYNYDYDNNYNLSKNNYYFCSRKIKFRL